MGVTDALPPAVLLYHRDGCDAVLGEIAAGLEEEGVPLRALPAEARDMTGLSARDADSRESVLGLEEAGAPLRALQVSATGASTDSVVPDTLSGSLTPRKTAAITRSASRLAQAAAEASRLGVGLGAADGLAVMTVRGAKGCAVFTEDWTDADGLRRLGQNAARAVKGTVFACR